MVEKTPTRLSGVVTDFDKAKAVKDDGFVAIGLGLVLQAKAGLAQYVRDNHDPDEVAITPDLDAKIAAVAPDTAMKTALGLVSLYDATIFGEQTERERYLREHGTEQAQVGAFTNYENQRDTLKRHIVAIGQAALEFFPEGERYHDTLAYQLADEMHRL